MRRFAYCFDPVPLTAVAVYAVGRWALRPIDWAGAAFVRGYLNDLVCIPIFLPAVLLLHRGMGLRRHDGPPTAFEILIHLTVWAACFEVVAPRLSAYRTTADPLDVVAYTVGALVAGRAWGSWRIPAAFFTGKKPATSRNNTSVAN